jgi:hypothetical protein
MMKVILAVAGTAVIAFPAGMWAEATMAPRHLAEMGAANVQTISPSEMHRSVKPDDLPIQYTKGDFN